MISSELFERYRQNPIVTANQVPGAHSIFNSAVIAWNGKYAGVFRVDDETRNSNLHVGFSNDGIKWTISPHPLNMVDEISGETKRAAGYDPRITELDDKFYVTWCCDCFGPTICMAWTDDFETFHQLDLFLPANRNGVLFPRKINGMYTLLTRPTDNSMRVNVPFDSIFCLQSPDLKFWGKCRLVMSPRPNVIWEYVKIGAGPVPIETDDGWLLIYHGVLTSCSGNLYYAGGAILDKGNPWKVLYRSKKYLMAPSTDYERIGDVPNVIFPVAAVKDGSGLRMYYGGADTCTCMATVELEKLVSFIKENS
ncbi:MAG: glycoside hydrolase family 130 protein [Victivallales bacterium]